MSQVSTAMKALGVLLGLLLACLPASAAQVPSSFTALLHQAAAALNHGKPDGFAALAAPGVDTRWARDAAAAPDPTRRWVADAFRVHGQRWAVFSLDKMAEMDHDHLYRAARRAGRWRLLAAIDEAEPGRHWRIAGHDERVTIEPDRRFARFSDAFRVQALGHGWPVIFDLGHEYPVEAVQLDGRPVSWTRAGNLIRVDAPVRSGATVRVDYRRAFRGGPGPLSNIVARDALFYADWLPVIAFQPAPSRITLDTPAGWGSIATGALTRTRQHDDRIARTFTNVAPVSFIMAAAGRYTVTRRTDRGSPLATYMLDYDREKSERGLDTLAFALPFYTARFGPIPWKAYALVETSALQGLAQEGYSYSVYSRSAFPGECAHELGHSWWGGLVNNTYFGSYWNESLTAYSTDLVTAARRGEATAHAGRLAELRTYRALISGRHDLPLMQASRTPFGPVTLGTTYAKGAMVCHMLRRELGDDLFFQALRRFAAAYAGKAAEWEDLDRVTTAVAHRPMKWFFAQWTRRAGGLRLHWEAVTARPLPDGRSEVQAMLCQAGAPYQAHVAVAMEGTQGRASRRVWLTGARTPVRLVVPGAPARLVADPDDDLLRYLEPTEIPANPWSLFYDHRPLLIVYGTEGDAAYRKVMRRQAEAQADFWRANNGGLLADLARVQAVPDTGVTGAERRNVHLIVIGKPGANRLMDELAGRLPVQFGPEGGVTIAGRTIIGAGLVTITNTRSPWNRDRLLRTWSADTAAALARPWEESSSGGNFPLTNAAWVARRGRLLAWSDAGILDRRSYVFANMSGPKATRMFVGAGLRARAANTTAQADSGVEVIAHGETTAVPSVHADRIAPGYCNHCDTGRLSLPCLRTGARERKGHLLPEQRAADRDGNDAVHAG